MDAKPEVDKPVVTIVRDPKVYLIGKQTINDVDLDRFLADEGVSQWTTDTDVAGQKLVELSGRLCYTSYSKPRPGGNKAYIGHILEVGHGSVCEHAVYNFIITGVSRSLTHELVRHRAGMSPSQLSQRFVDESGCSFVEPDIIAGDPALHALWLAAIETCQSAYKSLADGLAEKLASVPDRTLRRKKAREAARSVLPNATETKIAITINARALRHLIELRGSAHADVEIRKLAFALYEVAKAESPNLFGDYRYNTTADGTVELVTDHRKV